MTQYKAGQTVEVVTDQQWTPGFDNGAKITLKRLIPENEAFGGEWEAVAANGITTGIIRERNFRPIGPVRTETVTKRRIVPGVYGRLRVGEKCEVRDYTKPGAPTEITVEVAIQPWRPGYEPHFYDLNAEELDSLAMVASQLAEALRDGMD